MEPKRIRWSQVRHHKEIYFFVVPTLVAIGLFIYYPAASGVFHSFFRWNGADIVEPQGMLNYKDLLFSTEFWRSFRNAFIIGLWNVVKMIPPLFVAVCIHRCSKDRMQFFYRVLFVVPMVIPPLVIALIWRSFFFEATAGYLNRFIDAFHLQAFMAGLAHLKYPFSDHLLLPWGDVFGPAPWNREAWRAYIQAGIHTRPAWLGDPKLIMTAVVIWGFPWVSSLAVLTHLAKLQGIGKDIYEAAEIDGASWWSKFTRIELPLITGSIYIMLVFTIIGTIIDAGMIIALAGFEGGPGGRVDVPALFMIRKAFIDQKMGYACAVGIILMLIVMSLQKVASLVNDWSEYDVDRKSHMRRNLILIAVALNLLAPAMRLWKDVDGALLPEIWRQFGTVAHWWVRGWTAGYKIPLPAIFHISSILLVLGALPYPSLYRRLRSLRARALLFTLGVLSAGVVPLVILSVSGLSALEALRSVASGWSFGYPAHHLQFVRNLGLLFFILSLIGSASPGEIAAGWRRWRLDRTHRAPESPAVSIGDRRNLRIIAREDSRAFRIARTVGSTLLRFNKHFYIWFVLAFAFLPLYLMIIVSFKTNTQFYAAPASLTHPIHPENWISAWKLITPTLANSLFLSVTSTLLMLTIALMGAYFFARLRMPMSGFLWNAILILMMLPMIANLVPLFRLLRDMNLLNTLSALILVGAAQGQIFAIFMLRNFLQDIPQDLYEAAEIDGASHFRQMALIVLPLSGPILGTVGVMYFMTAWNDFVLPLIVMRDHARLPVMVQLIRMAGEYIKLWGPLMAGYALASIPIIVLFTFSMKLFVRGMTEGAVKG